MTQETRNRDIHLDDAVRAIKADEPTAAALRSAANHVWQRVQSEAPAIDFQVQPIRGCDDVRHLLPAYSARQLTPQQALLIEAHLRDCLACRHQARGRATESVVDWSAPQPTKEAAWKLRPRFSFALAAAAALLIAGLFISNAYFAVPAGARARVQSLDGAAYRISATGTVPIKVGDALQEGELLRTSAGAHTFVQLSDGSIMEVRDRSEFSVKARGKDTTIALDQGAVLVQAAKRKTGHLYVKTPDCRVAVTGTIFSVNSGTKGSRVAVIEGVVHVAQAGNESVLRAGDQVSTSDNLSAVPVQDEIAWSRDHEKYVLLLAQFVALRQRLDQVPLPAPRYSSDLLDRMPSTAVLYVSIPNLGETLSQANAIFQDQLQKSPALREWWESGNQKDHEELNATIEKLRLTSQYLGDEVVILGLEGAKSTEIAIVADVHRDGLGDFLKSQSSTDPANNLVVVNEQGLPGLTQQNHGIALVREHEVIFSNSPDLLRRINTQLNTGASGFADSEFGRQIAGAYSRGAGFIVAANLHQMMRDTYMRNRGRGAGVHAKNHGFDMQSSGLADAQYLIAEHRELNGVPENHLNLQFAGQRQGVASWLAAPAPMGSLEYVSRNAGLVLAFVAKEPQAIVDDILHMTTMNGTPSASGDINNKLHMDLRRDVAAHIGGEAVIALDGPVLPTPSWKLVVEVHDPAQLQSSLERLMQTITEEAQKNGHDGVSVQAENISGQPFYTVRDAHSGAETADYTYVDGYMILGSSRAIVMEAMRTHATGDSLARSTNFRALLPKDENENYSAIGYQNLSPVLQPLLSQLKGEEAAAVQQLAADARPTVFCAWGKENRIEASSNSRLFGLDFLALGTLLDSGNHRVRHAVQQGDEQHH